MSVVMASKRKKVVVAMEEKLKALKRIDKGETFLKVAQDCGVRHVTVGDWKRNRAQIEKWCSERVNASPGLPRR